MIKSRVGMKFSADAEIVRGAEMRGGMKFGQIWTFECWKPDGSLRWALSKENIIVNVGLDDVLNKYMKAVISAALFVGLKDTGVPVAADTMASHASWNRIEPYSNGTRPALSMGTASSQSIDNSASKASFNIDTTDEIFGAFLTDDSNKTSDVGLLFGVVDFGASRNVLNLDTLNVTVTTTSASV